MATSATPYVKLGFTLDGGIASRAAVGLIVLATDHTIEYEWRQWLALDGVGLYQSRIMNDAQITPETLRKMETLLAPGAEVILPGERLDVVAFGCTSASMVLGEETVFERIREARPGVACTTPVTAARVAMESLGTRRIAMLTPYVRTINESMAAYLEQRGVTVVRMGSYEHADDNEVARIDAASVRSAAIELGRHDDVEAVFVSCTSLRLADAVCDIEAEIGKPVSSSNHAMAWHALRLAGVQDSLPKFGRLFATTIAGA